MLIFFAPVVLARGLKDELAATWGAVVNITSIAGSRVHPFAGAAYAKSKAALAALTREVANDFLCSNQSSYVTGTEILINGGQHV